MKRRSKGLLLAGGLTAATAIALVTTLGMSFARSFDRHGQCDTGFSPLVSCTLRLSTTTTGQSAPIFPTPFGEANAAASEARPDFKVLSVDTTAWSVAQCPENRIARRLICSAGASADLAGVDGVTGLPLPKPWFVRTAKNSKLITSTHVETPLALEAALDFYRAALKQRGWTQDDGARIAADRAVIAFTTAEGPALLRLVRFGDSTIADLSVRKAAVANDVTPAKPGQAKLMLGNPRDQEAVFTVNAQTVTLAAHAGETSAASADDASKLPERQKIDLPPGIYKVALSLANGAVQHRAFEVAAGETWSLMAGPDGVPLPLRLY